MTQTAQAQSPGNLPGLFFERRYSARTLFNLQASKPADGPKYQHGPQQQWGQLSSGLSGCGSLKNLARKVYTELEPESNVIARAPKPDVLKPDGSTSKVSKPNLSYQCRCGCGTTVPLQVATPPTDSRTLAAIFAPTNHGTSSNHQQAYATGVAENYFAQW